MYNWHNLDLSRSALRAHKPIIIQHAEMIQIMTYLGLFQLL